MSKKFQIFISSTFTDLQEERAFVTKYIMKRNGIPAGMEFFSARPQEQFEHIKTIIDEVDYYLLIVAGRYGSLNPEGISYTELEFDYAKSLNIPILAFIKKDEAILPGLKEQDEHKKVKLERFKTKVGKELNSYFSDLTELGLELACLQDVYQSHPRPGWQRDPNNDISSLLATVDALSSENVQLKQTLSEYGRLRDFDEIADEHCTIYGTHGQRYGAYISVHNFDVRFPWKVIFLELAANMTVPLYYGKAITVMNTIISDSQSYVSPKVSSQCFHVIKAKLLAYGLIKSLHIENKGEFLELTEVGLKYLQDHVDELARPTTI